MATTKLTDTVGEIQLSYRPSQKLSTLPIVKSSTEACELFQACWTDDFYLNESFFVLYLNRRHRVLGFRKISMGSVSGTIADARAVFATAILLNASAVILAHNHPSGNLNPSEADKKLTNKLKRAGEYLDIPVLDHLILTEDSYFSFSDNQMM